MKRIIVALLLLAATSGCSAVNAINPFDRGSGRSDHVQLRVQNLNFNDATLHSVTTGARVRLGIVSGKASGAFDIPLSAPQDVQIEVDLVGESPFLTNPVPAQPGETLELRIEVDSRSTRLFHAPGS